MYNCNGGTLHKLFFQKLIVPVLPFNEGMVQLQKVKVSNKMSYLFKTQAQRLINGRRTRSTEVTNVDALFQ